MNIKFASFNLFQYCKPPYSFYVKKDKFTSEQWSEKTTWIKNQIKSMDADIIAFQEVFSINDLEALCFSLGYKYFFVSDEPKTNEDNDKIFVTTIVALASRFPIKETYKVKEHENFKFSRKPIKALIELPNKKEIIIYVNHLKSNRLNEFEFIFNKKTTIEEKINKTKESLENGYSSALKQRILEVTSLYFDMKKTFETSNLPIVFLCDLNDKEFSLCIDALTNSYYHTLNESQNILFDAYYLKEEKIYNPHPEKKVIKRPNTSYFQGVGNVLDYVFVSNHLKENIISYKVFDKHLKDNQNGSLLNSDHAQVVCEVQIN